MKVAQNLALPKARELPKTEGRTGRPNLTPTRNRIWPLVTILTLVGLIVGACTQQGGGPPTGGAGSTAPKDEPVVDWGIECVPINSNKETVVRDCRVTKLA